MFYCEACAGKAKWPTDFWLPMSHGRCELCGRVAGCFDVRSTALPDIPDGFWQAISAEQNAGEYQIEEQP